MGNRKVVQIGHTSEEVAIPANAQFWFDIPDGGFPRHAPFSLVFEGLASTPTPPDYNPVVKAALPQSLSGPGAIGVTQHSSNVTSTGVGDALTLANGVIAGQLKMVTHVVDGGSAVLTPVSFADGATITFTAGGERWVGIWTGTAWQTIELSNVSDGGVVLPAIA